MRISNSTKTGNSWVGYMYSAGKFNNKKENGKKYNIYIILDLLKV